MNTEIQLPKTLSNSSLNNNTENTGSAAPNPTAVRQTSLDSIDPTKTTSTSTLERTPSMSSPEVSTSQPGTPVITDTKIKNTKYHIAAHALCFTGTLAVSIGCILVLFAHVAIGAAALSHAAPVLFGCLIAAGAVLLVAALITRHMTPGDKPNLWKSAACALACALIFFVAGCIALALQPAAAPAPTAPTPTLPTPPAPTLPTPPAPTLPTPPAPTLPTPPAPTVPTLAPAPVIPPNIPLPTAQ